MASTRSTPNVTRRGLLLGTSAVAAGVAFPLLGCKPRRHDKPEQRASEPEQPGPEAIKRPQEMNAWVVILPDNNVVLKIPQAEIGQGTFTALAQILAEELHIDWAAIRPEFYDPSYSRAHGDPYVWSTTLGSKGITDLFKPARLAAAKVRIALLQASATTLQAPIAELVAEDGHVRHVRTDRALRYADVAADAARLKPVASNDVDLSRKDFRFIGKSVQRIDVPAKVDGSLVYGIDLQLPGMKYAAIRQSPEFHGKLKSYDESAIKNRPGVIGVVRVRGGMSGLNEATPGWGVDYGMDDAVAVIANDWWTAKSALDALPIVWESGPWAHTSSKSLEREFKSLLQHPAKSSKSYRNEGDAFKAIANAAKVVEAEYEVPYTEHATMEPMNATARVDKNGVEVWVGTQFADEALRVAAHHAGVPVEKAKLHMLFAGGGFGRRINSDFVGQAVQIASALPGVPVKLLWTREETIQHSYYPPLTMTRLKAGLDQSGNIVGWFSRSVSGTVADQTYGTSRIPQTIPNVRVEYDLRESPPRFGWKRGVGFAQHTWMNQSFIDELAQVAGRDPLEFQLSLLQPDNVPQNFEKRQLEVDRVAKQRRVLEELGRRANWPSKLGPNRGKGLAVHDLSYWPEYLSTGAACVVEVTLKGGDLKIDRVVCVLDCGRVINPESARGQIEGGIAYGLSDALFGEITLENGRVVQSNFTDYPVLHLKDMPKVEVYFLESDRAPEGLGEYGVPMSIAALVNAIHAAGGPRFRRLPIAPQLASLRTRQM